MAMAEAVRWRMVAAAATTTMAGWPIDGMDPIDGGGRHPGPVKMKIEARKEQRSHVCMPRVAGTAPLVGCALISEVRALLGILRAAAPQRAALAPAHSHRHASSSQHHVRCRWRLPACSWASCCCCAHKLLLPPLLLHGDALPCHPYQLCT